MRIFLLSSILAVAISFGLSEISFAGCFENPPNTFTCDDNAPNPDPTGIQQAGNNNDLVINILEGAAIDTIIANGGNGGQAIRYGTGNHQVTITGASISSEVDTIFMDAGPGNNTINVTNSTISAPNNDAFDLSNGNDIVNFTDSTVTSNLDVVFGDDGNDTVTVTRSTLTSLSNDTLCMSNDDDTVTITDSTLSASPMNPGLVPVNLGGGNDTITLNNGAVLLNGGIQCGADFDTIIFAMQVPSDQIDEITAQIESLNPDEDSITINGLFYEWENCEELVANLEGGFTFPVPTLSEWGLIAMASILGIVGFMVVRRRQITA